ncbi:hypothetical protein ACN47E_000510 [Coniothyrium glycines]
MVIEQDGMTTRQMSRGLCYTVFVSEKHIPRGRGCRDRSWLLQAGNFSARIYTATCSASRSQRELHSAILGKARFWLGIIQCNSFQETSKNRLRSPPGGVKRLGHGIQQAAGPLAVWSINKMAAGDWHSLALTPTKRLIWQDGTRNSQPCRLGMIRPHPPIVTQHVLETVQTLWCCSTPRRAPSVADSGYGESGHTQAYRRPVEPGHRCLQSRSSRGDGVG